MENRKRKNVDFVDNINKKIKHCEYDFIEKFKKLTIHKRKIEEITDFEESNKIDLEHKNKKNIYCCIHDNNREICQIYNCTGQSMHGIDSNMSFISYIN